MSAAKHTPGPWRVGERNEERHALRILSPGGNLVGEARGATGPWSDVVANAKLIAAAPALADALEAMLRATTNDNDDDCINHDREHCDDTDCWSCRARAALRAAGRAP